MNNVGFINFVLLAFCVSSLSCAMNTNGTKGVKYSNYNSKPFVGYLLKRAVKIRVFYSCADRTTGEIKKKKSGGSGVVIYSSKKGFSYVLTAEHVVDDESDNQATCHISNLYVDRYNSRNGLAGSYKAVVVNSDSRVDLALLKVRKNMGVSTGLASSEYIGQQVHSLGFPVVLAHWRGVYPVYTKGVISVVGVKTGKSEYTEFTAKIFYGNSGGGIYTNSGKLVTVTTMFYWYGGRHVVYYGPSLKVIKKFLKSSKFYYNL